MTGKPWALRTELSHLYGVTLVWAECPDCKRGSQWSKLPAKCKALGCQGIVGGKPKKAGKR